MVFEKIVEVIADNLLVLLVVVRFQLTLNVIPVIDHVLDHCSSVYVTPTGSDFGFYTLPTTAVSLSISHITLADFNYTNFSA